MHNIHIFRLLLSILLVILLLFLNSEIVATDINNSKWFSSISIVIISIFNFSKILIIP